MTYETEYNIDDTVFIMRKNRIVEGNVIDIMIEVGSAGDLQGWDYGVSYRIRVPDHKDKIVDEFRVFKTKAELLAIL